MPLHKKQRYTQADHDAWLIKMGISNIKKIGSVNDLPDLSTKKTVSTSNNVGNGYKKPLPKYTGTNKLVVGQGYHKGNYIVLSAEDAADPATGKRRI